MPLYQEDDYKTQYKSLKRKLKILIYENECFQDELRKSQRTLLRIQRDKSYLLDRILQYQRGPDSSSDSDQTEDSDNENEIKENKRRKFQNGSAGPFISNPQNSGKSSNLKKKKSSSTHGSSSSAAVSSSNRQSSGHRMQPIMSKQPNLGTSAPKSAHRSKGSTYSNAISNVNGPHVASGNFVASLATATTSEGPMSREEIERHLAARQPITDFSTISLTLPNQLFSDNIMEGECLDDDIETSPSNLEDEVTVDSFD